MHILWIVLVLYAWDDKELEVSDILAGFHHLLRFFAVRHWAVPLLHGDKIGENDVKGRGGDSFQKHFFFFFTYL